MLFFTFLLMPSTWPRDSSWKWYATSWALSSSGSGRVRAVAHEVQVADLPAFTLLSCRFTNSSSGRARLHAAHVAMLPGCTDVLHGRVVKRVVNVF